MNLEDISNYAWELISTIGKGGSSTVYKAAVQPLSNLHSSVSTGYIPSISASSSPSRIHAKGIISPTNHQFQSLVSQSQKYGTPPSQLYSQQQPIQYLAVKEIDLDALNKNQLDSIQVEINTMKDLNHQHIVNYYGMQQRLNRVYIFMEYAKFGSIRQFYQKYGRLTESETVYCLKQILLGLNYLHSIGFAHRDIKCANCLLFDEGVVKLADFGASKRFESESIVSGLKGTPHWMAPEVIKGTQMTAGWIKADVWSLGCTVVEMITGRLPYAYYENPITAMYRIASGEIPKIFYEMPKKVKPQKSTKDNNDSNPSSLNIQKTIPDSPDDSPNGTMNFVDEPPLTEADVSIELQQFIQVCCALEPNDRPSIEDLLKHPLFSRYENQEIPTRLFTLREEPLIPVTNSLNFLSANSMTLNNQLNSRPNTFSSKALGLQSVDGNIAPQPLTFESQATPAMGIRRNFSNFDEAIFLNDPNNANMSINLPPKSSHSYMNQLAFSREGTANNGNYIGGLNYYNFSNPPSQRSSNRFSASENQFRVMTASSVGSHSDDFDIIKQSKLSELLIPLEQLDNGVTTVYNVVDNPNEGIAADDERRLSYPNLRVSSSGTNILAPIKSMDLEEIEDETERLNNLKRHNHRYGFRPEGVEEEDVDEVKEELEGHVADDSHENYHEEDFEVPDEEDHILQKSNNKNQAPVIAKQPSITVNYRYQPTSEHNDEGFNDSYEDSDAFGNKGSLLNQLEKTNSNNSMMQKINLTPVKLPSKGNLTLRKVKEEENVVVERPIAPLTSEKLQYTDGGELSPVKDHHLNNSQPLSLRNSRDPSDDQQIPSNHIIRLLSDDESLQHQHAIFNMDISSKVVHKDNDVVQLSPGSKDHHHTSLHEKELSMTHSKLEIPSTIIPGVTAPPVNLVAENLKVNKLPTKTVGAKFIHHPPHHQRNNSSSAATTSNNGNVSANYTPHSHRKHTKTPTTVTPSSPSVTQGLDPTELSINQSTPVASSEELKSTSTRGILNKFPSKTILTNNNNQSNNNNNNNNNNAKEYVIIRTQVGSTSRSVSAGPALVSSHSNKSLQKRMNKHFKGKKLNPTALKLPPLEAATLLPSTGNNKDGISDDDSTDNFGERYVQSAPAVARSTNLPPIHQQSHHNNSILQSQTIPNAMNNNQSNHHQGVLTSITPKGSNRKARYPMNNINNTSLAPLNHQPYPPGGADLNIQSNKARLLDGKKSLQQANNNQNNTSNLNPGTNQRLQPVPEKRSVQR